MYPFDYHRPRTLDDVSALLAERPEAKLLAGGMTLLPAMKLRLAAPSDLVDLAAIDGLDGVSGDDGRIRIGAMTTHAAVAADGLLRERIPALAAMAGGIGDGQVRNRGTLGGSIANNDPAADYPAAVLALETSVVTDRREIDGDAFFRGMFETALEPGEIVTALEVTPPEAAAYRKFRHPASGYAVVGVMVARYPSAVRVTVVGAGDCVFRVPEMEAALGEDFAAGAIADVAVEGEAFNDDAHASAAYRAHLVGVLARRAVQDAGG